MLHLPPVLRVWVLLDPPDNGLRARRLWRSGQDAVITGTQLKKKKAHIQLLPSK